MANEVSKDQAEKTISENIMKYNAKLPHVILLTILNLCNAMFLNALTKRKHTKTTMKPNEKLFS